MTTTPAAAAAEPTPGPAAAPGPVPAEFAAAAKRPPVLPPPPLPTGAKPAGSGKPSPAEKSGKADEAKPAKTQSEKANADEAEADQTAGVPVMRLLAWAIPVLGLVAGVAVYSESPLLAMILAIAAFLAIVALWAHRRHSARQAAGQDTGRGHGQSTTGPRDTRSGWTPPWRRPRGEGRPSPSGTGPSSQGGSRNPLRVGPSTSTPGGGAPGAGKGLPGGTKPNPSGATGPGKGLPGGSSTPAPAAGKGLPGTSTTPAAGAGKGLPGGTKPNSSGAAGPGNGLPGGTKSNSSGATAPGAGRGTGRNDRARGPRVDSAIVDPGLDPKPKRDRKRTNRTGEPMPAATAEPRAERPKRDRPHRPWPFARTDRNSGGTDGPRSERSPERAATAEPRSEQPKPQGKAAGGRGWWRRSRPSPAAGTGPTVNPGWPRPRTRPAGKPGPAVVDGEVVNSTTSPSGGTTQTPRSDHPGAAGPRVFRMGGTRQNTNPGGPAMSTSTFDPAVFADRVDTSTRSTAAASCRSVAVDLTLLANGKSERADELRRAAAGLPTALQVSGSADELRREAASADLDAEQAKQGAAAYNRTAERFEAGGGRLIGA